MQFLPSFHIVLTCSFVVLLAYVLSRFFTYLAHSAIHGSNRARTKAQGSSRGRRNQSSLRPTEQIEASAAAMYQLQEEDENEDEADAYQDADLKVASHSAAAKYEMGGGIFDDAIDHQYNLEPDEAAWGNGKSLEYAAENGRHDEEGAGDKAHLVQSKNNKEEGGMGRTSDARENGLSAAAADDLKEEDKEERSNSVLRDAEGSSSLRRRLPPTWSDLEKIVSTSSMKYSVPPSLPPLPEY